MNAYSRVSRQLGEHLIRARRCVRLKFQQCGYPSTRLGLAQQRRKQQPACSIVACAAPGTLKYSF